MRQIRFVILFTLGLSVTFLSACKKDKSSITLKSSMSADIDGTATSFDINPVVLKGTFNGNAITTITGYSTANAVIQIIIYGDAIAGKTYTGTATDLKDQCILTYAAGGINYVNNVASSTLVTVSITSVGATSIQGTFKGGLIESSPGITKTTVITNGKFTALIVNK